MKSLYEYLIGKHNHELIRGTMPYVQFPSESGVERGPYAADPTPSVRLWKAARVSLAVAFNNGVRSEI